MCDKFVEIVNGAFKYLEKDYLYKKKELEIENADLRKDKVAKITYLGNKVGVVVAWYIGENSIGVGIYELHKGTIPKNVSFYGDKGFSRAINLNSLCDLKSEGKEESPIPEITPNLSLKEMYRRADIASKLIKTDMVKVIDILADRLKKYGGDILKGDVSIFPKVQELHKKKWHLTKTTE